MTRCDARSVVGSSVPVIWRGCTEISETQLRGGEPVIGVLSHVSGNTLSMRLYETERNRAGEIVAWHYAAHLGHGDVQVTLFND